MASALEFERHYSAGQYFDALVALLPKGPYWDEQLAEPESDLVRELMLQAASFKTENDQVANSLKEGLPHRAVETLAQWEMLAGLDGAKKTLVQRQEALRRWRSGILPTWETLASIAASYGYKLSRKSFPLKAWTTAATMADVLADGRGNNVVHLIINANGKQVRPAGMDASFTMGSTMSAPLFLPFTIEAYFPLVPVKLRQELEAALPIYKIVELRFTA